MPDAAVSNRTPNALSAWFSPRRKRFWAIVLFLGYTLFGFFLAPWIARQQIVELAGNVLQRPVSLRELRINPYVLSAEAREFRVDENDGAPLVSFDRLYINFQLSSLFRRALVFREIKLEAPLLNIVRDESGTINLVTLLTKVGGNTGAADDGLAEHSQLPRVVVADLTLAAGVVDVADRALETDFETRVGPIDVSVANLSTLPDDSGEQRVRVTSDEGTEFEWSGSLQITPLISEGRVTVTGRYLPLLYRYFQDQLNFTVHDGEVDMQFAYRIALPPDDVLTASIDGLSGRLVGITARVDGRDADFLRLPTTRLTGGYLHWPARRAGAGSLEFDAPAFEFWRDQEGELIFSQLLVTQPNDGQSEDSAPERDPAIPWDLRLDTLRIADMRIGFADEALIQPGRVDVPDIDFEISNLSNEAGAEFPTMLAIDLREIGRLDVEGTLAALPTLRGQARLSVADLALATAQPWVSHFVQLTINHGRLHADVELAFGPEEQLALSGATHVDNLAIDDATLGERLVSWDLLNVDRFRFEQAMSELEFSEITFEKPFVRLLIAEDGATNFAGLMRADSAPADDGTEADGDAAPTVNLTVGRIQVNAGEVNFSDLALPFPFHAEVRELEGGVSTLATASNAPATIDLEGKVDEYGFARIAGSLLPADPTAATDINVLFRNVEFPDLSPYTIKFAGRHIDDGRLEVELNYRIEGGELDAQNSVVIDRIALGEKVDYPDAMSLPLGLAVALLQDSSGKINIDLPVTGNVNDPDFSAGGVVLRAFANLITKAVTSPFRLLGGLVGVDSENFDQIEFEPGQADLTPPEREKLEQLASALELRPTLKLTVGGALNAEIDAFALRTARVDERVEAALDAEAADAEMIATRRREAIEDLFRVAFPDERPGDIRPEFQVPVDPDKPEGKTTLDELAYVTRLRDRLVAAEPIDAANLDALAGARADSIVQQLIEAQQPVPAERIERGAAGETEPNERGFIPVKLELGK